MVQKYFNAIHRVVLCIGLALLPVLVSAKGCDVSIMSVQPCDDAGVPHNPNLGDDHYAILVTWKVVGKAAHNYSIHLSLANQTYVFDNINALNAGTGYKAYTSFAFPVDGPIPISATIDPEGVTGDTTPDNNTVATTFTPTPPATPIEYYSPRTMHAINKVSVTPLTGDVVSLTLLLGEPGTGTFQKIIKYNPPDKSTRYVCPPYDQPIWYRDISYPKQGQTYIVQQDYKTTVSNVRVNWSLQPVTWQDLASLPSNIKKYTASSPICEANHPDISKFVLATLGNNYKQKYTPISAARKLFQAVVARTTSVTSGGGSSAVGVLKSRKGDCGGFAILYIATLRNIGIPARPVQGWREGINSWHGWAEMYLPGYEWIDQDPNAAKFVCPDGSYAAYFSVMPDLNARTVTGREDSAIVASGWDIGGIQIGGYMFSSSSSTSSFDVQYYTYLGSN